MNSMLSPLQDALLAAFFRRERRFHLTDGAALAGFHLGHRTTLDLDLFTTEEVLDAGDRALRLAAGELGGNVENLTTAPTFRRRLVRRAEDSVVVDLVLDVSAKGGVERIESKGVILDPPAEILANKLSACRDPDPRGTATNSPRLASHRSRFATRNLGLEPSASHDRCHTRFSTHTLILQRALRLPS